MKEAMHEGDPARIKSEKSIGDERFTQDGNPTSRPLEAVATPKPKGKLTKELGIDRRQHGIADTDKKAIASLLAPFLADNYVLYLKTQNYHWNVTGPNFLTLHTMFMNQYMDLALAIDLIAERIRALGHAAPGTFLEYSELASVKEQSGVPAAEQMVKTLNADQETLIQNIRNLMPMAERCLDFTTADLLTQRLQVHEKNAWMLRSTLGVTTY